MVRESIIDSTTPGPRPLEVSSIILPIRRRVCRNNRTRRRNPGLSTKAEVRSLNSDLDRVRERSEGGEADLKAAVNIAKAW